MSDFIDVTKQNGERILIAKSQVKRLYEENGVCLIVCKDRSYRVKESFQDLAQELCQTKGS